MARYKIQSSNGEMTNELKVGNNRIGYSNSSLKSAIVISRHRIRLKDRGKYDSAVKALRQGGYQIGILNIPILAKTQIWDYSSLEMLSPSMNMMDIQIQ